MEGRVYFNNFYIPITSVIPNGNLYLFYKNDDKDDKD